MPGKRVNWGAVALAVGVGMGLLAWGATIEDDKTYFIGIRSLEVSGTYAIGLLTSLGSAVLLIPVLEVLSAALVRTVIDLVRPVADQVSVRETLDRSIRTLGAIYTESGWTQVTAKDHADVESICFTKDHHHCGFAWRSGLLTTHAGCALESKGRSIGSVGALDAPATETATATIERFVEEAGPPHPGRA